MENEYRATASLTDRPCVLSPRLCDLRVCGLLLKRLLLPQALSSPPRPRRVPPKERARTAASPSLQVKVLQGSVVAWPPQGCWAPALQSDWPRLSWAHSRPPLCYRLRRVWAQLSYFLSASRRAGGRQIPHSLKVRSPCAPCRPSLPIPSRGRTLSAPQTGWRYHPGSVRPGLQSGLRPDPKCQEQPFWATTPVVTGRPGLRGDPDKPQSRNLFGFLHATQSQGVPVRSSMSVTVRGAPSALCIPSSIVYPDTPVPLGRAYKPGPG